MHPTNSGSTNQATHSPKNQDNTQESKTAASSGSHKSSYATQPTSCCCPNFSFVFGSHARERQPLLNQTSCNAETQDTKIAMNRQAFVDDIATIILHRMKKQKKVDSIITEDGVEVPVRVIIDNKDGLATLHAYEYNKRWYVLKSGSCEGEKSVREKTKYELTCELKILSSLRKKSCNNIIHIINEPKPGIEPYLAMLWYPYILHDLSTQYLWQTSSDILHHTFDALKFLEENNIVHNDIKPENIFLDSNGQAVLADFGLASHIDENRKLDWFGTQGYMSPEMINQTTVAGYKSDVWGLYATWFLACFAVKLIPCEAIKELQNIRATSRQKSISDRDMTNREYNNTQQRAITKHLNMIGKVCPQITAVFLKCLNPDPEQRPDPASVIKEILDITKTGGRATLPIMRFSA